MSAKKKWIKPVVIVICRGNENGNVLLTCKQTAKGCTINANSKSTSF